MSAHHTLAALGPQWRIHAIRLARTPPSRDDLKRAARRLAHWARTGRATAAHHRALRAVLRLAEEHSALSHVVDGMEKDERRWREREGLRRRILESRLGRGRVTGRWVLVDQEALELWLERAQ